MMNKKNSVPKKGGIAEEIEKLKQRREDRKNKGNDDNSSNIKDSAKQNNGKVCDAEYENLIRKKKIQFNQEPENVKTN